MPSRQISCTMLGDRSYRGDGELRPHGTAAFDGAHEQISQVLPGREAPGERVLGHLVVRHGAGDEQARRPHDGPGRRAAPHDEIEVSIVEGRITLLHADGDPAHLVRLEPTIGW